MKQYKKSLILLILSPIILFILYIVTLVYGWPYQEDKNSIIPNHYLEVAIRSQIGKPIGKISPQDCLNIKKLDLSSSDYNTDLEGLQYFIDLESLTSDGGNLKDISALANLKNLKYLELYLNNIKNLTPLSSSNNLEYLDVSNNKIEDVSPLKNLTNLKDLVIYKNYVKNYDSLADLANLRIYK